ncbi:MAG: REP-associated tyrosine transposase [Chthoniobacterales bacterium]
MIRKIKGKPPRLELIFQRFDAPVYFVTFNTHRRAAILANACLHAAFVAYCTRAENFRIGVGRYVIMPDHIHLFVCLGPGCELTLSEWIRALKRYLDRTLSQQNRTLPKILSQKLASFWQPGFHDHLLRSDESYAQKWGYVFENPVRAGLVSSAEDWPFAGEIVRIDRV